MMRMRLHLADLERRQAGHCKVHTRRGARDSKRHEGKASGGPLQGPHEARRQGQQEARGQHRRATRLPHHALEGGGMTVRRQLTIVWHTSLCEKKLDAAVPAPRDQSRVCGPPVAPESMLPGARWSPLRCAWIPAGTSDESTLKAGETGLWHLGLACLPARLPRSVCGAPGRQVLFQEGWPHLACVARGLGGTRRQDGTSWLSRTCEAGGSLRLSLSPSFESTRYREDAFSRDHLRAHPTAVMHPGPAEAHHS